MQPETSGAKEQTILDLSREISGKLNDLQCRFDGSFSRNVEAECTKEEKPQHPNVLDEVLENLHSISLHVSKMTNQVSTDIIPKIL